MDSYIIPIFLIAIFILCAIKKVKVYDAFVQGASEGVPLVISLLPYVTAVLLMSELFEVSGLSKIFIDFLSPFFTFLGVPKQLIKLIIIKPFSGSGSLALLSDIISTYGTYSYITICASAIYGSQETVFYISAVYFVKCKNKKVTKGIFISLIATFIATVLCCNLLKFFF